MTQKPRRRWFQFSLRSLLIVMLLLSVGFGLYLPARRRSLEQWRAVNVLSENSSNGLRFIVDREKPDTWQKRLGIDLPDFTETQVRSGSELGDEMMLNHLLKLPQLESILISRSEFDDSDLRALSNLPKLKSFGVGSDSVTGEGMTHFVGQEKLQHLYLRGSNLSDRGLEVVARLQGLSSLEWYGKNRTSDGGLSHLRGNLRLTKLLLKGEGISDVGLEHLSTCENLEELSIETLDDRVTGKGIRALTRLKHLKRLQLRSSFSSDSMAALSSLVTLEELRLRGPVQHKEDIAALAPLTSLKIITITDTELTSGGLRGLANLKLLEELNISLTRLRDEDVDLLISLANLSRLNVEHSSVTDAGLMKLVGLKRLSRVELHGSKITLDGARRFKQLAPNVSVFLSPAG
ncbi:MAG: hypothetical protein ACO1RA_21495 [Planctomycetaceae bacterium]